MPLLNHQPSAIGHNGPLPRFQYTLSTEDDERCMQLAIDRAGEISVTADTGWGRIDHDRHTACAMLVTEWPDGSRDELHLTGHQHRELEDHEQFGALLQGIAWRNKPADVLALLLPERRRAA